MRTKYTHYKNFLLPFSQRLIPPVCLNDVSAALQYLPAVDEAGGEAVNAGLYPQGLVLEADFIQCGAHAVDAHVAVDAERGREQVGEVTPKGRNSRGRP